MLYARLWLAGLALMLANAATAQDALPLSPTSMTEPGTASATASRVPEPVTPAGKGPGSAAIS